MRFSVIFIYLFIQAFIYLFIPSFIYLIIHLRFVRAFLPFHYLNLKNIYIFRICVKSFKDFCSVRYYV